MKPTRSISLFSVSAIALTLIGGTFAAADSGQRNAAGISSLGSEEATGAFAVWIEHHFTRPSGLWVCPTAQIYDGRGSCLAEFRSDRRWHKLFAIAERSAGRTVISDPVDRSWKRHWTGYRRDVIAGFHLPGKAAVNGLPAADWAWLAAGARGKSPHRRNFWVNAFDGNSAGFEAFEMFRCHRSRRQIRCRNRLGDAMRYRPRA